VFGWVGCPPSPQAKPWVRHWTLDGSFVNKIAFTNDAAGEKKVMFSMRWRTQNKIGLLEPLQAFFDNLL